MGGPHGAGARGASTDLPAGHVPRPSWGTLVPRPLPPLSSSPRVTALLRPLCCPPWPVCVWSDVSHLVGRGPWQHCPYLGSRWKKWGGRWQSPCTSRRGRLVPSTHFTDSDGRQAAGAMADPEPGDGTDNPQGPASPAGPAGQKQHPHLPVCPGHHWAVRQDAPAAPMALSGQSRSSEPSDTWS